MSEVKLVNNNDGEGPGYQYGDTGTIFRFVPGNVEGQREAKRKAHLEGAAIAAGVRNAFCATGQGGGIDPTCSPDKGGGSGGSGGGSKAKFSKKEKASLKELIDVYANEDEPDRYKGLADRVEKGTFTDGDRETLRDLIEAKFENMHDEGIDDEFNDDEEASSEFSHYDGLARKLTGNALMMPLLPKSLRVQQGDEITVSRAELEAIKTAVDNILNKVPGGQAGPGEEMPESKDDINMEGDMPAGEEEVPVDEEGMPLDDQEGDPNAEDELLEPQEEASDDEQPLEELDEPVEEEEQASQPPQDEQQFKRHKFVGKK